MKLTGGYEARLRDKSWVERGGKRASAGMAVRLYVTQSFGGPDFCSGNRRRF
jgi:hypothetical protein